jgi:hypothetical protein
MRRSHSAVAVWWLADYKHYQLRRLYQPSNVTLRPDEEHPVS